MAVVLLSNSALPVTDIGLHILDERLPLAPPPQVPQEIPLPADLLERYVGVYDMRGTTITITRSPDGLIGEASGQELPLHAESETTFFTKVNGLRITFQIDLEGEVTGLVLHQGDRDDTAKKVR